MFSFSLGSPHFVHGEQIKNEITNGIEITDTLKQILISEDGEIHQFETIAGNLMSDSIESVQLAPNGVCFVYNKTNQAYAQ